MGQASLYSLSSSVMPLSKVGLVLVCLVAVDGVHTRCIVASLQLAI